MTLNTFIDVAVRVDRSVDLISPPSVEENALPRRCL